MQPLSTSALYGAGADLQKARHVVQAATDRFPLDYKIKGDDRDILLAILNALGVELVKLDCRSAVVSIGKATGSLQGEALTYGGLIALVDEIDGRIRDEMGAASVFSLTAAETEMFDAKEPLLGDRVAERFPAAAFDIEEAAKCHALGRSTAAVFHAMRVLEYGIKAISRCLGIDDPVKPAARNWGKVLEAVDEAIKAKWPKVEDRDSGDGHLFENFYVLMLAIKNPWRNKTMHPATKYTEQEADRVIRVVADFMQALAERCDENGEPKA